MILDIVSVFAVALLGITSTYLLVSMRWRVSMISLAIQYLAVFWLVGLVWPINLAVIKLVVGWMIIAIIGASQPDKDFADDRFTGVPGLLIKLLATSLVGLLVFSIAPSFAQIIPTGMVLLWGGLLLVGIGLLQLGMSTRVSRIFLGLFTLLSGFEILYAAVETSTLVAGLLAVINLGLALAGSYLLMVPTLEQEI